jgi:predicted ATPase
MVYVITGGPGFGKTTVLNLLAEKGFPVCSEIARELLATNKSVNEWIETNKLPVDFERQVAEGRMNFINTIEPNTLAFSDRGLPDQIAFSWFKKKMHSNFIEEVVKTCRYAPFVFVTPPWKAIYCQDEIRQENFEEASEIHRYILKAYLKCNYKIIDLPLKYPEERVDFILNFLGI